MKGLEQRPLSPSRFLFSQRRRDKWQLDRQLVHERLTSGDEKGYGDEYASHGQVLSGIEMNFGKLGKNHPTRYELNGKQQSDRAGDGDRTEATGATDNS